MTRSLPDPSAVLGYRRDGRPIHPVLGASAEDPSNEEPQVPLSQKQLSALMAREKDQGGRAAVRSLMDKLGFPNLGELEEFVRAQRQAAEQQLSESQRREQDLSAREQSLAARETAAAAREREAARRALLAGAGATGADLEDALALLRVDEDADEAAVREAAEALKSRRPELFSTAPGSDRVLAAPGGAPASIPPPRPTGNRSQPGAAGMEMARRRGLLPPAP
ncbi:hypothetical protein [Streptomyces noursei]|uniref:hypothetical protein n=1 Tax=Streptomyces noursei TaxID=1971 RepID=UPI00167BCE52|nr:hypothetical protein [Streptomyces noursei]MCZ1019801.1 hypothetical protein [Streptomyces noursei]GGX36540.1 hypothetical protein GCM10010341_67660 [Streptomyces noursei]